jgi:hypothetical protein
MKEVVMDKSLLFRRLAIALSALLLMLCVEGCAYFKHRWDDFTEIADIGFTISKKPYFAFYADELSLLPVGYAHVDGYFIGWGGGQLGKTTHSVHSWGVLAHGSEELGWHRQYEGEGGAKEAEANEAWRKREGFIQQGAGVTMVIDDTVRVITGKLFEGQNQPDHSLSCLHYIHLGWFGIVINVRTLDILDFILGWFGIDFGRLDLGGDDGAKRQWGLKPGGWRF